MRKFFLDCYKQKMGTNQDASLGLIVGGFSFGYYQSEVWHILIPTHDEPNTQEQIWAGPNFGVTWRGACDPIRRYALGYDHGLLRQLMAYFKQLRGRDFSEEEVADIKGILDEHEYSIYAGSMPMQQGIEYTRWLVEIVVKHYYFSEAQPIVGGDVKIGMVTNTEEQFRILDPKVEHSG